MSKIIIKEYDNTKAPAGEYRNFTVVVPGKVASDKASDYTTKYADENGIYECSNIKDFENYIGFVPGDPEAREATEPTFTNFMVGGQAQMSKTVDETEYYQIYRGELYYAGDEVETIGYLKANLSTPEDPDLHQLIAAPLDPGADDHWDANTVYYHIKKGNEGKDAVADGAVQNGNQIAYELIKLGYTVLFKKYDAVTDLDSDDFWTPLKDKANYDFRYIITGGYFSAKAAAQIAKIATFKNKGDYDDADVYAAAGRGDCVALIDIDETDSDIADKTKQADILTGIKKYTNKITDSRVDVLGKEHMLLCPQVIYDFVDVNYASGDTATTTTMPASFHYLACAAKANISYNEWWAVAGETRGISDLKVAGTTIKLGDYAVNALQPRKATKIESTSVSPDFKHAVNPVIKLRSGYYLWGNRTAAELSTEVNGDLTASHFANIRQLCITLKKQLYVACRKFTFDPNSDILWVNFCNMIRPLLEKMKADQGIADYKFIKVRSLKKACLTAKIRIVPIEAVEDFDLSIYLEDSLSGTTVAVTED